MSPIVCAIVDPVWSFHPEAGAVTTESADGFLPCVETEALAALPVNIRRGGLPKAEAGGHSYLRSPVGKFGPR